MTLFSRQRPSRPSSQAIAPPPDREPPALDNSGAGPSGISVFGSSRARDTGAAPRPDHLSLPDLNLGREVFADNYPLTLFNATRVWDSLNAITLNDNSLQQKGLFTKSDQSPVGPTFDLLRTSLVQAMAEKEWRRIGITSPTRGCGKSYVAANLALSLARRPGSRTILLDLDLRHPNLHQLLGVKPANSLQGFLDGSQPLESSFLRAGDGLALALNDTPIEDAAGLLHSPDLAQAFDAMESLLEPEITLMDISPALLGDDVLALRDKIDTVLIVADGSRTTAKEIRACEALFENRIPIMGMVLNRAEDPALRRLARRKK